MYGIGTDRTGELIDIGVKNNIISKSGAWFSYGDESLGQGRENVKEYLNEHTDILKDIESKIYDLHNIKTVLSDETENEDNFAMNQENIDKKDDEDIVLID